jgi:hypothetical protein
MTDSGQRRAKHLPVHIKRNQVHVLQCSMRRHDGYRLLRFTCSAKTMPASSPTGSGSRVWDPPAGPVAELGWPSRGASAEAASASVTFSSSTSDSPAGAATVPPEQQMSHA